VWKPIARNFILTPWLPNTWSFSMPTVLFEQKFLHKSTQPFLLDGNTALPARCLTPLLPPRSQSTRTPWRPDLHLGGHPAVTGPNHHHPHLASHCSPCFCSLPLRSTATQKRTRDSIPSHPGEVQVLTLPCHLYYALIPSAPQASSLLLGTAGSGVLALSLPLSLCLRHHGWLAPAPVPKRHVLNEAFPGYFT
jgi:hypothetical protein